jgi:hypothetical protein
LVFLKTQRDRFQIGNLVYCRVPIDFDVLTQLDSSEFQGIEGPEKGVLSKDLRKVGLGTISEGIIIVNGASRWGNVSQMALREISLPSTTNSIESMHVYMIQMIPRRHPFWRFMWRIVPAMINSTKTFRKRYRHSFISAVRMLHKRAIRVLQVVMKSQCEFYRITEDVCLCGESVLLSAVFDFRLPCRHQYSLNSAVQQPILPNDVRLRLDEDDVTSGKFLPQFKRLKAGDDDSQHVEDLKRMAISNIKRVSDHGTKADVQVIRQYVDNIWVVGDGFAMNIPRRVL